MTIENLGVKLYSGTKADRKSDSLGSSANGTNNGVTLLNVNNYAKFDHDDAKIDLGSKFDFLHTNNTSGSISFWIKGDTSLLTSDNTVMDQIRRNGANKGFQITCDADMRFQYYNPSASGSVNSDSQDLSDEKWHHVVLTIDFSNNQQRFYIDGVANTQYTRTSSTTDTATDNLVLGHPSGSATDNEFRGGIKQLLIYDDVLTQSEVTTLYNSGSVLASASVSTSNLQAHYPLETNSTNSKSGGTNGTDSNMSYESSEYKLGTGAYFFDGSDDYVEVGDNMLLGASTFTITGWIYPTTVQSGVVWSQWSATADSRIIHFYTDVNSGKLYIIGGLRNGSSSTNIYAGDGNEAELTMNAWNHVALTFDGSAGKLKLYLNGVLKDTVSSGLPSTTQSGTTNNKPLIGKYYSAGTIFAGRIDDMGIWKRVLTATEIGKLANNNDPPFTHTGDQNSYATTSIADNSLVLDSNSGSGQTTSPVAVKDLGTLGSSWCVRWSVYAPTQSESISGKNSFARFGFSDKGTYSSSEGLNNVTDKAILWNWHLGTSLLKNMTYTGGSGTNNGGQSISYADDTTWYWEMKYDGSTVTITRYNSDYSSAQVTADTISVSGYTGMNYLVIGQPRDHNNGTWKLRFDNIKIWNNQSSATGDPDFTFEFDNNTDGGDAQLVSSLTDKSNLKAYYSMDSIDEATTPTHTQLFENASDSSLTGDNNTGGSSYFNVDSTVADALYVDPRRSSSIFGQTWDLGTTLSETSWVMRTKYNITSLDNSGDTVRLFFGMNNQNSTVGASDTSNKFIGVANAINSSFAQWYRLSVKGNTLDVGETSQRSLTTETLYIEIIRKSETKYSVRLTNNSDFTGGTFIDDQDVGGNGGSGSTSSMGLRYVWWSNINVNGNQNAHEQGNFEYVKIWDGVTEVPNCKNDHSATSDLEALSGVRTNSIFQQTDDTPSYWWYQSDGTWKLDGGSEISPTGTWNSSGYTNHSSFTQDSGKITYTCSSGNGQNGGAVASYDLGSGFDGDTDFIFRFRIKFTNQSNVSMANTSFSVGIGKEETVTSSQGIFNSTDQILWRWAGSSNDEYRILTNVDGSNYQSSGQSFTPSTNTYYHFEIVRSGATSFTINRYSDDTYKTVSDSESTTSAGNPNSLRYIQMGTSYDHQIGSWVAEVDEMKIQSGSTWLE